jgi:CRISPR-associated protein Csb2
MLVITVELLHGTIRCASTEDATLTGHPSAEWPPSPARLYQALVAADGTGSRSRVTGGPVGLDLLEAPPVIRAVEYREAPVSAVNPRYVVIDTAPIDKGVLKSGGHVQDYPAREAQLVRPGARVAPKVPVVAYVWPDALPRDAELVALRARCARVGYLGAADSPVRVRVSTEVSRVADDLPSWQPSPQGDLPLPVAYPGFLDDLDVAFADWSDGGSPRRGAWIPRLLASYVSPGGHRNEASELAPCLWLRFDRSVPGRRVLAVTQALRAALLEGADRAAGGSALVPAVIHGHHEPGARGVEHCRVLALPNAGFPQSDGRIHGACLWFPPGTDPADVELARTALAGIARLVGDGGVDVGLSMFDGVRTPVSSNPARWVGPARRWVSVFPVVHERRVKGALTLAEVTRWCQWAGLTEPVSFREARVPLVPGAVTLAPTEALRSGANRPYSHLELSFADPISGPVALGWGRHFGLGLMAPTKARSHDRGPHA